MRRFLRTLVSGRLHTFFLLFALVPTTLAQERPSYSPQPLTVAAAADLQYVLPLIASAYTQRFGVPVRVSYGSSGNLTAQISNGAPFDVLLSADQSYPRALISNGFADASTLTPYARGSLVLWFGPSVPDSLPLSLSSLLDARIQHVAIANPRHAPYGRAAEAALRSAGVYDKVVPKLVLGENISQTAQFVESGNAQAGLVALSLLQSTASGHAGRWAPVPLDSYPALDQAGVVTSYGARNPAARQFLQFLRSADARTLFQRFGFLPPSSEGPR